ncbi:dihydrofolate reductase family protein [Actinokineospora auranticolor]|uniref:5-amino-6-(5-phosphoribosylamino)uracil reductase n=1 Tax=Actinokineospora auranticolor TaxID=155976 RepID=A0A2S6H0A2_9PSEU|nr:dihydrofolate reductase family protein [Actinokineospora auranticolor]PPK70909.1 5-amino-6-(5-phosphoribosylamino)uracil reductase [Actinokineospora auranticolor]
MSGVRPYVLASVAVSVDGYIDDRTDQRLLLSNADDFARVDRERAGVDAILVGGETVRRDNPRLLVNDPELRAQRVARGRSAYPLKVVVSGSGELDPGLNFFHHGDGKVLYTTDAGAAVARRLDIDTVSLGATIDFGALLDDLGRRGVRRLMVEGGQRIHTAFLQAGLVDELHLVIAPVVVGQTGAPRFLGDGDFPRHRMRLVDATRIGDVVLLRYFPKETS